MLGQDGVNHAVLVNLLTGQAYLLTCSSKLSQQWLAQVAHFASGTLETAALMPSEYLEMETLILTIYDRLTMSQATSNS